jgi:hypothetical protein
MQKRFAAAAALAVSCASAHAQPADIPRTAEGRPDFTGAWLSPWITTLERMPGASSLELDEAGATQLGESYFEMLAARGAGVDPDIFAGNVRAHVKVGGRYRTSIVIDPDDGRIPYTAAGRAIVDAARSRLLAPADGPEARPDSERCIAGHGRPPMTMTPTVNPRQITQTPAHIALYAEDGPDLRIIPFGGARTPPALRSRDGSSTARWEADALVIDTTNLAAATRGGVQGTFATSAETRVTERLTMLSADEILYGYTVADPVLYTRPWRGEYVIVRTDTHTSEYGCHEGNYSMFNMLTSARVAEARAKKGNSN